MWNIFLQRNKSKIVDLLYGMTCNQIECSECHEVLFHTNHHFLEKNSL